VWVAGQPGDEQLRRWAAGVPLEEGPSQPVRVNLLRRRRDRSLLELEMGEGRNRQIRRTAALLGHPVLDLQRVAIGSLALDDLPEGHWRHLERQDPTPHHYRPEMTGRTGRLRRCRSRFACRPSAFQTTRAMEPQRPA
jgi:16S rRNA U516 pseudouridylate synthase RsuA-like enzyme